MTGDEYHLYDEELVVIKPASNGLLILVVPDAMLDGHSPRTTYVAECAERAQFIVSRLLADDGWPTTDLSDPDSVADLYPEDDDDDE